ncbi:MAG: cystathionine gamma-synthase [Bdellovibrionales bacterium]
MSWNHKEFGFETRAIHAGQEPDPTTGAIMTPVYLSSTYVQSSPGVHKGYEYSRTSNPTRKAYEDCVASLENAKHGFAFASGCAATTTIAHMMRSGDHIILGDDLYGGTFRLFDKILRHNGIEMDFIDLTNLELLEKTIKPNTKMVWIETPTNPMLQLIDIKSVTSKVSGKEIITVVDNTFMSPYLQNPIDLGADIVCHSSTKFINGHSDVVGGVLTTDRDDIAEKIQFLTNSMGGIQATFDSFLCMRSLKTLAVRMKAHEENGRRIADYLENHPKVEKVIYPGLSSHPQHELAKKQMRGFGGMISFFVKGGMDEARKFLENVKVFALAESLGGVESLIEHPAIMTHASIPADQRKALGIHDNFVRLSVGIESIDDLIKDLDTAFSAV